MRQSLVIIALFSTLAVTAEGAVLRFRAKAKVGEGMVRVGDVADIESADEATTRKLAGISLAPAPAVGQSVKIDYELVRGRLTAAGIDMTGVQFTGRSLVQVTGATPERVAPPKIVQASFVSDSARDQIVRRVAKAVNDYLVKQDPKLGQVAVDPILSAEQATTLSKAGTLEVTGGSMPWTGKQLLAIRIREGRTRGPAITVECLVTALESKVQVKRVVRKGEILTAADVELVPALAESTERRTLLRDLREAIGLEAQRALRPGDPVAAQDLKKVLLVQRNTPVTVISRVGSITVSLVGKSDSDGAVGEAVTVSTLDRKQKLTAWVTGYHEVSVTRPEPLPESEGQPSLEGRGTTEAQRTQR